MSHSKLNDKNRRSIEKNMSVTQELLNMCKTASEVAVSLSSIIKNHVSIETEIWEMKIKHYEKSIAINKLVLEGKIDEAKKLLDKANSIHLKLSASIILGDGYRNDANAKNKELAVLIENSKKIANGYNESIVAALIQMAENKSKKTGNPVDYTVDAIHIDKKGNVIKGKKSIEEVVKSLADET